MGTDTHTHKSQVQENDIVTCSVMILRSLRLSKKFTLLFFILRSAHQRIWYSTLEKIKGGEGLKKKKNERVSWACVSKRLTFYPIPQVVSAADKQQLHPVPHLFIFSFFFFFSSCFSSFMSQKIRIQFAIYWNLFFFILFPFFLYKGISMDQVFSCFQQWRSFKKQIWTVRHSEERGFIRSNWGCACWAQPLPQGHLNFVPPSFLHAT